ncbi:MAG: 50S ribosomal protein L13 [Candidatus Nealsonbacteria bacterium]|nr:50S ribosomal protein L13 [Candidatus Nealsonbacteria bacterium]
MQRETHHIDATDKSLGRLASRIAVLLRGKHKPEFIPRKDMGDVVVVDNVDKMKITGKKLEQKKYYRHSGYPGGIKETPLKDLFAENPGEVLKRAVYGMLPKNRLRSKQIKRLKFSE